MRFGRIKLESVYWKSNFIKSRERIKFTSKFTSIILFYLREPSLPRTLA